MKAAVICVSMHHGNTRAVASAMADVLKADLLAPSDVDAGMMKNLDVIGLGSGIYGFRHHRHLMDCVERIPPLSEGAFIFSTRGFGPISSYHATLRRRLRINGIPVLGEFSCPGHDTYGPLRWIGGINRNRPNERDIERAHQFARGLLTTVSR